MNNLDFKDFQIDSLYHNTDGTIVAKLKNHFIWQYLDVYLANIGFSDFLQKDLKFTFLLNSLKDYVADKNTTPFESAYIDMYSVIEQPLTANEYNDIQKLLKEENLEK